MSFAEIRHQEPAVAALQQALAMERLPHGFIFVGPAGVGKAMTARALATVLLCDQPGQVRGGGFEACGTCPQCALTAHQSHPDLSWYRKPRERAEFPIGVVTRRDESPEGQTINESVQLKAMQARSRVTVIEDAELMNAAAANAFLKTFEEAPEGSYLILLVTALDRMLPTIRSRGRIVRFRALPAEFVAEILQREQLASGPPAVVLARFADGSLDQARALARSGFLELRQKVIAALPELSRLQALKLSDEIFAWAADQASEEAETDVKTEENFLKRLYLKRSLDLLASLFRDALLTRSAAESNDGDAADCVHGLVQNSDALPLIRRLSALPAAKLEYGVGRFLQYQGYVDMNVHMQLLTENACLELADLVALATTDRDALR